MSDFVKLTCTHCGQVNRLPGERLEGGPKCGTCGGALTTTQVAELDFATLKKAISSDQLPLIVDFWAPWCGPCRMMAPHFASAAKALAPGVRFAKIDTQRYPQASQAFGVRGIPLLVLFDRGQEVARLAGARPASEIEAFVRSRARVRA